MTTRRWVIGGAAGAAVLAAAGYRAWDRGVFSQGQGPAYEPWGQSLGKASDGAQQPLHAAILAASAHNTQPWLFQITDGGFDVLADRSRNLGAFDPFRREMHISLGCAITNLLISASINGYQINRYVPVAGKFALSPPDVPALAAQLGFTRTGETTTRLLLLARAMAHRHTNRGAYIADKPVPSAVLNAIVRPAQQPNVSIAFITDPGARKEFGSLIVEATQRIVDDAQMSADSARWLRAGAKEIDAHRDGITLETSGLSPLMVDTAKMLPDMGAASADKYWLAMTRDTQVATAPAYGVLLVQDRMDMPQALSAGQVWQLLHLSATTVKLAAQPMNQPMECIDRNAMLGRPDTFLKSVAEFAKLPDWQPAFVFRMGTPMTPVYPSPRRPLGDVIRRA